MSEKHCRTASNLGKRKPTATVTTTTATAAETEDIEEINDENENPNDVQDASESPPRELQEAPKPTTKTPGKRSKDKLDVQNRMLDLLEKDLSCEQDPLEMQFIVMSKRVKQQLPTKEHFSLALKLSGIIEEEIVAYERRQIIASTQLNDDNFLNTGANNVTVTQTNVRNPAQVHTLQVAAPMQTTTMPPPMIPRTIQQGGQLFHERHFNFQDI